MKTLSKKDTVFGATGHTGRFVVAGMGSVNEIVITDVQQPLLVQMKRQPKAGQMPPV